MELERRKSMAPTSGALDGLEEYSVEELRDRKQKIKKPKVTTFKEPS
jgi:hypothetical protein